MLIKLDSETLKYINDNLGEFKLMLVECESISETDGHTFYTYEVKMSDCVFVKDSYVEPTKELGVYLEKLLKDCGITDYIPRVRAGLHIIGFGETDEKMIERIKKEMNIDV